MKKLIFTIILILITSITSAYALDFKTRYANITYVNNDTEDFTLIPRIDKIIKRVYEILELKQPPNLIIKFMVYDNQEQVKAAYRTFRTNSSAIENAISFSFPSEAIIHTYNTAEDNILAHEITHILIHKATGSMLGNGKIYEIIPWYVEKQFKEGR